MYYYNIVLLFLLFLSNAISCHYGSTLWSTFLGGEAHHLHSRNGIIYVSDGFRGVGAISFDGTLGSILSQFDTDGEAYGSVLHPFAPYLFVADGNNGLIILNVTAPSSISLMSTIGTGGFARKVAIDSGATKAFLASEKSLIVVDISNVNSPAILGNFSVGDNANDVYLSVDQTKVFMAIDDAGIIILNVTNINEISVIQSFPTAGFSKSLVVSESERLIYVADGFVGIAIYDWDGHPRGSYSSDGINVNMLSVQGKDLFAADRSLGLMVFDKSNVDSLELTGSIPLTLQGDRGQSIATLSPQVVALGIRRSDFGKSKLAFICVDTRVDPSTASTTVAATATPRSSTSKSRTATTADILTRPIQQGATPKRQVPVQTIIIATSVGIFVVFLCVIVALGIYRRRKGSSQALNLNLRTLSKKMSMSFGKEQPKAMDPDTPKPVCPDCHKYWEHSDKCCGDCGAKLISFPAN